MALQDEKALVLFSGGQDSTTCLAWALETFARVETVGFFYGQNHSIEMEQRHIIRTQLQGTFPQWADKWGQDHVLDMGFISALSQTALTHDKEIEFNEKGLPSTFVPARNLFFFTIASTLGYRRGIKHLVGGMCETDYSGYPDCRDDTLKALQVTLTLGLDERFVIHTPLMWKDKADTWQMTQALGGQPLVDLILEHTHTCYKGDRTQKHPWGYGCNACPACDLRATGWEKWCSTASLNPQHLHDKGSLYPFLT